MKCHYHSTLDSTSSCSVCRRSLCTSCANRIKRKIYCQDCLVAGAELAGLTTDLRHSPGWSAFFALMPGLGAAYNRQYAKAVVHFTVLVSLIVIAQRELWIFWLAATAFYTFTILDSYGSARAILREHQAGPEPIEEEAEKLNAPVWGGIIVLLGVVLLLNNLGVIRFNTLEKFWPLILIGSGIYLILDYLVKPQKTRGTVVRTNQVEGDDVNDGG